MSHARCRCCPPMSRPDRFLADHSPRALASPLPLRPQTVTLALDLGVRVAVRLRAADDPGKHAEVTLGPTPRFGGVPPSRSSHLASRAWPTPAFPPQVSSASAMQSPPKCCHSPVLTVAVRRVGSSVRPPRPGRQHQSIPIRRVTRLNVDAIAVTRGTWHPENRSTHMKIELGALMRGIPSHACATAI